VYDLVLSYNNRRPVDTQDHEIFGSLMKQPILSGKVEKGIVRLLDKA
jgi:hypothetical protein